MKKIPFARILSAAGCLAAFVLLTGCFETKQEFTLNPDGSGKVVHESKFQNVSLSGNSAKPEAELKASVANIINKAKGVDAWRDVSFRLLEDGRFYFKGTAYFKNLSALDLPNQTMLEFDWARSADGTGVLTMRKKPGGDSAGSKAGKKPVDLTKLTPTERAAKIKEERAKFQQMKPMMSGFIGTMQHEAVLHLPGKPGESSNFTKDPSGALRLQFDGARLLNAMETLINDDAWVAKNSGSFGGMETPEMDERVRELLFGGKGPVRATVSGLAGAAFDYDAEIAAAKQDFPMVQQQLGTSPVTIAAPAQGGSLKSLKVVGVRLVSESDEKREIRPFNADAGYTLSLLAELPGSVLVMTDECGLDTAIADDGSDLLLDSEWKRKFAFPKLSADRTAVLLEAELKLPAVSVQGLKELTGHLQYRVANSTKEIELGFKELTANAEGTALGAQIESIKAGGDGDGAQLLDLQLKINPDTLKVLYLVVGKAKTELKKHGYSGFDNSYTYTYESEKGFPAKSRLVAEIYDQLQTFDVPFKLENITLLGAPLNPK